MKTSILSLDIGTTVTKAILFDLAGRELAVSEQTCKLLTPKAGWVELDLDELFGAVMQVLESICQQAGPGVAIQAIALSTHGGSLVLLDADGQPTHHAVTWLDRRSEKIVAGWRDQGMDVRIRQISGWEPQPGLPLSSICAIKQDLPDVFQRTRRFLSINDYIVYKLTGRFCTNPSMAGEMLLLDIQSGAWSHELCELAGIQVEQLSPILPSDAVCGTLSPYICQQLGLAEGIPLINGGQDHSCEALALGMTTPGKFLLACGTAWVVNAAMSSPDVAALPPEMALNAHVIPQRWIASQFLGGLGAGMEWWLDRFWQSPFPSEAATREKRYASFNNALLETQPGSSGLLYTPVGGTPHSGVQAGGYTGLQINHTRAEMGRAVLESAAYELRWAVENMRDYGMQVEQLWLVGGATRNPVWPQILADATGIPISITQYSHGPALGAALLAAKGLGLVDEFPNWVTAHTIEPNSENQSIYSASYARYRSRIEAGNI